MKLNKHGQALIEFVLVLPVLLLLIFAFIDFGRIILCKNHLESVLSEVVILYNSDKSSEINEFLKSDDDYNISFKIENDKYTKIILNTKLDLITPGLNKVLSNPYSVIVERSIIDE